jgi:hypothetical protein
MLLEHLSKVRISNLKDQQMTMLAAGAPVKTNF